MSFDRTNLVIIGGGPGGIAPLLAAHRRGRLAELLEAGVTIVDRGDSLGAGSIGDWCISSDSTGFTFADCLAGPPDGELAALRQHPLTKEMAAAAQGTVNLLRREAGSSHATMPSQPGIPGSGGKPWLSTSRRAFNAS